jgi:Trypsin-like serine proteases, typically periplasmic, contain C-terminal PDZ domain
MKKHIIWLSGAVVLGLVGFAGYSYLNQKPVLQEAVIAQKEEVVALSCDNDSATNAQQVHTLDHFITASQLWRPVQDQVKDTVVQIFSHVAVTNLLQPYVSPNQGAAYGSGFLISDQGDIITNAHVVDQAKAIWIQIPSLGKRIIDVEVVGVSPERDIALLRITPEGQAIIKKNLGKFLSWH